MGFSDCLYKNRYIIRIVQGVTIITTIGFTGCIKYISNRLIDLEESIIVEFQAGTPASVDGKIGPIDVCAGFSIGKAWGKPTWWRWEYGYRFINAGVPIPQIGLPVVMVMNSEYRKVGKALLVATNTHLMNKILDDGDVIRISLCGLTEPGQILFINACESAERKEKRKDPKPKEFYSLLRRRTFVDNFGIEASACIGMIGFRGGFNIAEFADFIVGWFGIEITGELCWPKDQKWKMGRFLLKE